MICPFSKMTSNPKRVFCGLSNFTVNVDRICSRCQSQWSTPSTPPTLETLPPILVSLVSIASDHPDASNMVPRPVPSARSRVFFSAPIPSKPRPPESCVHCGPVVPDQPGVTRQCGYKRLYVCEHPRVSELEILKATNGQTNARHCGICPYYDPESRPS